LCSALLWPRQFAKGLAIFLTWKVIVPFISKKIAANFGTSEID
jgi:hypothetical protein